MVVRVVEGTVVDDVVVAMLVGTGVVVVVKVSTVVVGAIETDVL